MWYWISSYEASSGRVSRSCRTSAFGLPIRFILLLRQVRSTDRNARSVRPETATSLTFERTNRCRLVFVSALLEPTQLPFDSRILSSHLWLAAAWHGAYPAA